MKHNLCIRVSKKPQRDGIVQCRSLSIREKLLTRLLGRRQKVIILIPGNTVSTVSITEIQEGGVVYLSAELEALSKAEQREAMESDEREGLVRLYLDTLLPEDWDGMDIFERRNFLTGSDFGSTQKHGTVKRTQVSNMEIWCECFGKERANIRRTDSNELTAILARLGWKRLDSKVRIPLYGPQYVFVPKECS